MSGFRLSVVCLALMLALVMGLGLQPAAAQSLEELAREAAQGPTVIWYESSPEEQIDKVIEVFNRRYPDVRVEHVRILGGNEFAARAVQETQARGWTADVLTGGPDHMWQLDERGILEHVDWEALGIAPGLSQVPYSVATAASVYVVLWNTNWVSDAERPQTWDDIFDPKWKGRIGHWVRAGSFAQLAYIWGVDKARERLLEFVELEPFLFQSTFPLAQQVAAGEVDVAIGFYHTAQPPINAGAPLAIAPLDPVPMHTISTGISRNARNMAGAKLFVAWLSSLEGARAYEAATSRGNPLLPGTETYEFLRGYELVEWPAAQSGELAKINEEFNVILARAER